MQQGIHRLFQKRLSYLASLSLLLVPSASAPQKPRYSDKINDVAWRVINSLRKSDWKAFTRDAMPFVVLSQCNALYESKSRDYKENSPIVAFEKNMARSTDFTYFDESMVTLETRKDLSSEAREDFTSFCTQVRSTWDEWKASPPAGRGTPRWVVGEYLEGTDSAEYLGAAVNGSLVSNEHWRIEFVRDIDGWRVSRLVSTTH